MLKIGVTLTLELRYGEKIEKYKCKLVEKRGQHLYIDYPINTETNKTVFLLDGTQLKCSFVDKDGVAYLFESEVLGRMKQNIPMLILAYPGDHHCIKIQRRQFVRVETSVDAAIHPRYHEFKPFVTVTDDISAGGSAIITPNKLHFDNGQELVGWFVLPMQNGEYHYLKFLSKVVRTVLLDSNRNKVSLQFLELSPHERQILLRFCFDQQLMMKKKGLEI